MREEKPKQHILDKKIDILVELPELFYDDNTPKINRVINQKLNEYWNDGYKQGKSDGQQGVLKHFKKGMFELEKEFYLKK